MSMKTIFDISVAGRRAFRAPAPDVPCRPMEELLPEHMRRTEPAVLPEVSELDLVRHYTELSRRNMGVDTAFYPLGSCTMKYNPKYTEQAARMEGFSRLHPLMPERMTQGMLALLQETEQLLSRRCGMHAFTLQPAAGAHGELTGMLIVQAYHVSRRQKRNRIIVPDSAHGTNPASAAMTGCTVTTIPSDSRGMVDVDRLAAELDEGVACVMMTNPNTLGLFEERILDIAAMVHDKGALLYYDGANLNALAGICRPGDMGFDIMHRNLHKTFATPHGGGGPGAGPVGVAEQLEKFLPGPRLAADKKGNLRWQKAGKKSIGRVKAFHGSIGVIIKAYAYLKALGDEGIKRMSAHAVLHANYLLAQLRGLYEVPYGGRCMHEFVASACRQKERGVRAVDIAKALLDRGFHAPTIYFPLIVQEALMIEPTETESKQTLDAFVEAMRAIDAASRETPDALHAAPATTPVSRLDEVQAARRPVLRWRP